MNRTTLASHSPRPANVVHSTTHESEYPMFGTNPKPTHVTISETEGWRHTDYSYDYMQAKRVHSASTRHASQFKHAAVIATYTVDNFLDKACPLIRHEIKPIEDVNEAPDLFTRNEVLKWGALAAFLGLACGVVSQWFMLGA